MSRRSPACRVVDRETTRKIMDQVIDFERGTNWLGHRLESAACSIDLLLLAGATKAQMETFRGSVDAHIQHLEKEHSLKITKVTDKDGNVIYRFDI